MPGLRSEREENAFVSSGLLSLNASVVAKCVETVESVGDGGIVADPSSLEEVRVGVGECGSRKVPVVFPVDGESRSLGDRSCPRDVYGFKLVQKDGRLL